MSKKKRFHYPLVSVLWDDTMGSTSWQEVPKELFPSLMRSVGFLVKRTKRHIMLAGCYQETDIQRISSVDTIPIGCIISMKRLK